VLTVIDNGASTLCQRQIPRARRLHTVDLMREPVLVLDETPRIKTPNRAFYDTFGFDRATTVGPSPLDFKTEEWNISRLQALSMRMSSHGDDGTLQDAPLDASSGDGKLLTVLSMVASSYA
jgi:hypothetical protein